MPTLRNRRKTQLLANVVLARLIQAGRMNLDDQATAFGRRGRDFVAPTARADATAKPARSIGRIACLFGLTCLLLAVAAAIFWTLQGMVTPDAEIMRAEQKVTDIVNQPITHLPRSGEFEVFSPGWFHPGAEKPDFNNVDIRTTQELLYDKYDHVTSDLNPTEMFIGSELEFNAMTKYFYKDRTLPKKRLSDSEMVEINGLYRVIGQNEHTIFMRWFMIAGLAAVAFSLASALFLLIRGSLLRPAD
jgi:hypothetical protein